MAVVAAIGTDGTNAVLVLPFSQRLRYHNHDGGIGAGSVSETAVSWPSMTILVSSSPPKNKSVAESSPPLRCANRSRDGEIGADWISVELTQIRLTAFPTTLGLDPGFAVTPPPPLTQS
jgi:hypothetical protein